MIPLGPKKIGELLASPRPDKNAYDLAGPATLRLVFILSGLRTEVILPIVITAKVLIN
jgi:hypothetical protein